MKQLFSDFENLNPILKEQDGICHRPPPVVVMGPGGFIPWIHPREPAWGWKEEPAHWYSVSGHASRPPASSISRLDGPTRPISSSFSSLGCHHGPQDAKQGRRLNEMPRGPVPKRESGHARNTSSELKKKTSLRMKEFEFRWIWCFTV